MKSLSDLSIVISLIAVLILSLTGFLFLMYRKRKNISDKPEAMHHGKRFVLSPLKKTRVAFMLFLILFSAALMLLVNFLSVPTEPPVATGTLAQSSPPAATPRANSTVFSSPSSNQIRRFDELKPIIPLAGNFFINGWGDDTMFNIDDRSYSYGVGMIFTGTQAESNVCKEDSPEKTLRGDCKQFSVEYALRNNYSQLTFSIGADNGDPAHYGDENTRGIAQVVMSNKDTGYILFDTGWVNYTYAIYDATVDLSNVNVLEITYRTCGVSNENKLKTGLRFAIVDPFLVLKDDGE